MSNATDTVEAPTEDQRVESWRMFVLMEAGYSELDAARLSARFDVDLHQAVKLVTNGCRHDLAVDILL